MRQKISGEDVEKSSAFKSARDKAIEYAKNSAKLNELLDRAVGKASASKEPLAEVWDSLLASFRLQAVFLIGFSSIRPKFAVDYPIRVMWRLAGSVTLIRSVLPIAICSCSNLVVE